MKIIAGIIAFIFSIIVGTLISFLCAYIIIDVAKLYCIDLISQYSITQMFCLMMIISLVVYKPKIEDSLETEEAIAQGLLKMLNRTLVFLVSWGILYLVHALIA